MNPDSLLYEFVKALVTGGSFAVVLAIISYIQTKRRDARDGLFKAFDLYQKVMDYRAIAVKKDTYETWRHYYRSLFDLQWSEYQIWCTHAIPYKPYRTWLLQRYNQYISDETKEVEDKDNNKRKISYSLIWHELLNPENNELPYLGPKDDFVQHMKHVHDNNIEKALAMKPLF